MDFSLNDEQQLIIKSTREFVQNELYPHEKEVEETGVLRAGIARSAEGEGHRCRTLCREHAGGSGRGRT